MNEYEKLLETFRKRFQAESAAHEYEIADVWEEAAEMLEEAIDQTKVEWVVMDYLSIMQPNAPINSGCIIKEVN